MAAQGLANNLTEYGDKEFALYLRRSFAKVMGFGDEALGKPIVGIINTYSELNNCHRHFPEMLEAVKPPLSRGVAPMMTRAGMEIVSPPPSVWVSVTPEMVTSSPLALASL